MDDVDIALGLSFTTQTLSDGRVVPAVEAVDVVVNIDRNDIDIKIWGNIWADFASMFEVFFKSTVVDIIRDGISTTLNTVVPQYLNAALASTDGMIEIPTFTDWDLDWETLQAAIVTETSFELGAKGIMFDTEIGETEWSTTFPDMLYKDTTEAAQFQAFISEESIDSLMGSWLEVGQIEGWLQGDQLPEQAGMTLTCSDLDIAFSGLSDKYGADTIVDVHFQVTDLHGFTSSEADQDVTVRGTADLQFWPRLDVPELAVEINVIDILFTGGIAVNGYFATGEVSKFLVDKIEVLQSTIGDISAFQLKVEINTISRLMVPTINDALKKYEVPIPSDILGIFTLTNIFLKYEDGYIFGGATPTFTAPTADELYDKIVSNAGVYFEEQFGEYESPILVTW